MMLSSKPFAATSAARVSRNRVVSVRVVASDNGSSIEPGTKVKVTKTVKVYHAPGQATGLDLEGMVGVVKKNVLEFKGKQLSANLPYQVQFEVDRNGKPGKLLCHLVSDHSQERCACMHLHSY
jgi:hypothetical protein